MAGKDSMFVWLEAETDVTLGCAETMFDTFVAMKGVIGDVKVADKKRLVVELVMPFGCQIPSGLTP